MTKSNPAKAGSNQMEALPTGRQEGAQLEKYFVPGKPRPVAGELQY